MALDPSIPMGFNPTPLGPNWGAIQGNALNQANMAVDLQQRQQELQGQNALRALLGGPEGFDPQGNINPAILPQVAAASPTAALTLRTNMLNQERAKQQLDLFRTQRFAQMQDYVQGEYAPVYQQWLQDKDRLGAAVADEKAQRSLTEANERIQKSGLVSAGDFQTYGMPTWDSGKAERWLGMSDQIIRWRQQQEALHRQQTLDRRQEALIKKQEEDLVPKREVDRAVELRAIPEDQRTPEQKKELASLDAKIDARKHYTAELKPPSGGAQDEARAERIAATETRIAHNEPVTDEEMRQLELDRRTQETKVAGRSAPGSATYTKNEMAKDIRTAHPEFSEGQVREQAERDFKMAGQGVSDADLEEWAKSIAEYRMAPPTGYAMRSATGQKVMAMVNKLNPGYHQARFAEVNKVITAFSTGKQGDTVRSFNAATQHLAALEKAGEALKNGNTRLFNSIAQEWATQTGHAAPTTWDAMKHLVGTEIEKAVAGAIGSAEDRDRLIMGAFNKASSPEQMKGVFDGFRDLMGGQLMALKQQYEEGTGFDDKSAFPFTGKLLPEPKRALQIALQKAGLGGGGGGEGGGTPAPEAAQTVVTRQEFEALPPGARYRKREDPPGTYRVKPGAPAAAAPAPQQHSSSSSWPVPQQFAQYADGARFRGSDGTRYEKRGDRMVAVGGAVA